MLSSNVFELFLVEVSFETVERGAGVMGVCNMSGFFAAERGVRVAL